MDNFSSEITESARARMKRQVRKRNDAFRRRLQEKKDARQQALQLKLACAAATLSWAVAGIQLLR